MVASDVAVRYLSRGCSGIGLFRKMYQKLHVHAFILNVKHYMYYQCFLSSCTPVSLHMLKCSWAHTLSCPFMYCSFASIGHADIMWSIVSSNYYYYYYYYYYHHLLLLLLLLLLLHRRRRYHLYARYSLLCTRNKPRHYSTQCYRCSIFTVCTTCHVISHIKYVLCIYISTSRSLCAVLNMAVFCSSLISCFPRMLLRY